MSQFSGKAPRVLAPLLVSALVAAIAACGSWFNWFAALDRAWYDEFIRLHQLDYPEDIVIVAIDEASLDRLGGWPWDRRYHARLLDQLDAADAVVFDLIFAEPQSLAVKPVKPGYAQAPIADSVPQADAVLAGAMRRHGSVLLPVYVEQQQYRGVMQEVLPVPGLAAAAAALGHAHVEYDIDGIARGLHLRMGLGKPYWPHLSLALGDLSGDITSADSQRYTTTQESGSPYVVYSHGFSKLRYIGAARSIYRFSYIDVLDGLIPADQIQGKRVYVGATATGLGDDVPTPMGAMPGVEFHANAYQALRSDGYIKELGALPRVCLHATLALLVCLLLSRLAPAHFLAGSAMALLGWAGLVALLFFAWSAWVEPTPFVVAVLLFYPLWSWRRIEIALRFLRSELQQLQTGSNTVVPDIPQLELQLKSLVSLGALEAGSIKPVQHSATSAQWPAFNASDGEVTSSFNLGNQSYRIELRGARMNRQNPADLALATSDQLIAGTASTSRARVAIDTLACLMEQVMPAREVASDDSYELVERTIDEIYAARRVVERTQERMNQSMARLQDVVVVADMAGKIIFINDAGSEYFRPGLAGDTIFALQDYLGKMLWLAMLKDVMVAGKSVYQEVESLAGRLLLCQAARLHESLAARDTLLFVFTDVTQLRSLEQSKNEALAFLSHDMRSPLVSQLALIEKFRLSAPPEAKAQQPLLQKLVYFAERSLKYSEDFLQLSRAENLDQQAFQLVDMHGVVDGAYSQVTGLALKHDVGIDIERASEDCWMLGDAQLLERAVINLLSNAIQHSRPGQKIILSLDSGEELRVSITDQGKGIDAKALPHLFEPYFRARQKSGAALGGGAVSAVAAGEAAGEAELGSRNYGLGLSFVHSVVERHGGRVDVQSQLGKGTTFILIFQKTVLE